ncbi:MAG TPA: ABC transporter permease [Longimicrobiales bacterium]
MTNEVIHDAASVGAAAPAAPPSPDGEPWTTVIRPTASWLDIRLGELWLYRDLIWFLVRRNFVAQYKQTVLGPLWYLIQPLLSTIIFTIIFGELAGIPTDGVPPFLFYMAGNVLWKYFADSLSKTSNTFVSNAQLFGKVYFPRLAVPISVLATNLIGFAISFAFFLGFLGYFMLRGAPVGPNAWAALLPIQLLIMAGLGMGMGLAASAVTARYRDVTQLVSFGVALLMYATPIVWPLSEVPERYLLVALANPITPLVETFRYSFLGAGTVSFVHLSYSSAMAVLFLALGVTIFQRVERTFQDTV